MFQQSGVERYDHDLPSYFVSRGVSSCMPLYARQPVINPKSRWKEGLTLLSRKNQRGGQSSSSIADSPINLIEPKTALTT